MEGKEVGFIKRERAYCDDRKYDEFIKLKCGGE